MNGQYDMLYLKFFFVDRKGNSKICNSKVVSDFDLGDFKEEKLLLPSLKEFFGKRGRCQILIFTFSQTFLVLVSYPPVIICDAPFQSQVIL